MTPIQYIGQFESVVFTVDWTGIVEIKAVCPSEEKAKWVANGLAAHHKVEVSEVYSMPLARFVE